MTGPLKEAVDAVGEIMNVTLVPFGNARYISGELQCQHGEDECKANSWEQCAISLYPAFAQHWPFYLCIEETEKGCGEGAGPCVLSHTQSCAESAGLDYASLSACVNSPTESKALQEKFYKLTPSNHQYVPWVLVDGVLAEDSDNLLSEVCKAYKGKKPAGCPKALDAEAKRCSADW